CIIDGQGANYGFYFDRLMYDPYLPIILLEGFTITNCKTAIYLHQPGDIPDIKNCIITGNSGDFCAGIACVESCTFEISECTIKDNIGSGIVCIATARPTISHCIISNNSTNRPGGGILIDVMSEPTISNCIISGNRASSGGGLYVGNESEATVINCSIIGNKANSGGGVSSVELSTTILWNSIIWDNTASEGSNPNLFWDSGSCLPYFTIAWQGFDNDPCFVSPGYWEDVNDPNIPVEPNDPNAIWIDGDYHLQSAFGRWDPNTNTWVIDANTSKCIDAGNPASNWTEELWPHGKRINMGAFGGTPQASMSLSDDGNVADLNNDDSVDYKDLMRLTDDWLYQQVLLSEDLDRNGVVDLVDCAILADNWLW
ncbi:MAG: right-handed parallel beta-helix repeat-containing protein, partial [Planctomycetota bacterium]